MCRTVLVSGLNLDNWITPLGGNNGPKRSRGREIIKGGDRDHYVKLKYEKWVTFRQARSALQDMGLVTIVPHLFEGPDADAEIIFPWEGELRRAAHSAGHLCLVDDESRDAIYENNADAIPLPRHIRTPMMVGIRRPDVSAAKRR